MISLVIWSALVIYAFALLYTELQLFVLGFVLALVLGSGTARKSNGTDGQGADRHGADDFDGWCGEFLHGGGPALVIDGSNPAVPA